MNSKQFCGTLFGILLACCAIQYSEGEKILFFFGISSYSHRIAAWPLVEALAKKGHDITFLSPYPAKEPNPKVKEYVPQSLKKWVESWDETSMFHEFRLNSQMEMQWYQIVDYGLGQCEVLMNDTSFIDWVKSTKFDLVVVDALTNECAYAISAYQKSKVIIYNTAIPFPWYVDPFGYPEEASWIPDLVWHHPPGNMNFFQRAVAFFNPYVFLFIREMLYFPKLEAMIRKHLSPDFPSISSYERDNLSLLLVNHHYAEDFPRPFPPNVVPLPGLHCDLNAAQKQLPADLEAFLTQKDANLPVFYVSFGSYSEISHFPNETQTTFVQTLNSFRGKVKFIWKLSVGRDQFPLLGDHVFTGKWMPQQRILADKRVKGFITHGGLLGIQEAICHAKPLVAFPIFAEQDYNAQKVAFRGLGIKLEITEINFDTFKGAIERLLTEKEFEQNMKALNRKFLERPVNTLDLGVWWVEHVLREENVDHLKPGSLRQSWWKRRNLDVLFVAFLALFSVIWLILRVSLIVLRKLCGKKGGKGRRKEKTH